MKNKKMTYLLIVLVIVVWGLISYRIIAAVNTGDDLPVSTPLKPQKEAYNDYAAKKDTSKLSLNYRDPFNEPITVDTFSKAKPSLKVKTESKLVKQPFNWSFIKYSGFIRNPGSKRLIAMVNINGKAVLLGEGETIADVKLIKNLKDSIKVFYKNQTKFITMGGASL